MPKVMVLFILGLIAAIIECFDLTKVSMPLSLSAR